MSSFYRWEKNNQTHRAGMKKITNRNKVVIQGI